MTKAAEIKYPSNITLWTPANDTLKKCYLFALGEAKQPLQYTFEKALHTDLLKEYDKNVRPVKSRDHPMLVEFDLKMQRLVSYVSDFK